MQKILKKAVKILLIFIGMIAVLFLAAAGIIFGILTSDTWSEEKVTAEYGDEFTVVHEEFLDKWRLTNNDSHLSIAIEYYDDTEGIVGLCSTDSFKCYKAGSVIIYCMAGENEFKVLAAAEELFETGETEIAHGILLSDGDVAKEYLPFFLEHNYHAETRDMLERLFKGEYDGLEKYGLTAEVIADEERLSKIIYAAKLCC